MAHWFSYANIPAELHRVLRLHGCHENTNKQPNASDIIIFMPPYILVSCPETRHESILKSYESLHIYMRKNADQRAINGARLLGLGYRELGLWLNSRKVPDCCAELQPSMLEFVATAYLLKVYPEIANLYSDIDSRSEKGPMTSEHSECSPPKNSHLEALRLLDDIDILKDRYQQQNKQVQLLITSMQRELTDLSDSYKSAKEKLDWNRLHRAWHQEFTKQYRKLAYRIMANKGHARLD